MLNACRRQRNAHPAVVLDRCLLCRVVLNACRRQRNAHGCQLVRKRPPDLVLNACRRQRNAHIVSPSCTPITVRAQRLSASKECSRFLPHKSMKRLPPCSTPVGVKGMLTRGSQARTIQGLRVLNACRRQRNAHSNPGRILLSGHWCSTPVGVKGMLTFINPDSEPEELTVLNACRRQRNAHEYRSGERPAFTKCSTPVGVKGMLTGR